MPRNGTLYAGKALIPTEDYYGSNNLVGKKNAYRAEGLSFSFSFFNADFDYFQLGGENSTWFKSFLKALQDISKNITKDDLHTNISLKRKYRFHKINWEQKGLRIAKKDLDWVDPVFLDNDKEFEFVQLSISTGNGRIIGFFETCNKFQIVLLDPKHNMQPSKKSNYSMTKTQNCKTEIENKTYCLGKIEELVHSQTLKTECSSCDLSARLNKILKTQALSENEIHIHLIYDEIYQDAYKKLIKENPDYFQNLFESSLLDNIL